MTHTLNALLKRVRLARRKRLPDAFPSTVAADLTTTVYHPTKGWRRIAGRRVLANKRMVLIKNGVSA